MADLDEIRERWGKVTHGPWTVEPMPRHPGTFDIWGVRPDEVIGDGEVLVAEVRGYEMDAEAIAAAPEDVAWLLDQVEKLKVEVERRDKVLNEIRDAFNECFEPDMGGVDWADDSAIQGFARRFYQAGAAELGVHWLAAPPSGEGDRG